MEKDNKRRMAYLGYGTLLCGLSGLVTYGRKENKVCAQRKLCGIGCSRGADVCAGNEPENRTESGVHMIVFLVGVSEEAFNEKICSAAG